MATTVYDTFELELQNGTVVEIRPLPIKRLRRATALMSDFSKKAENKEFDSLSENESNDIFVDVLIAVVAIALERKYKDLIEDMDEFSDILDMPTMYKIVEIATGWNFNKNADDLGKALAAMDGTT